MENLNTEAVIEEQATTETQVEPDQVQQRQFALKQKKKKRNLILAVSAATFILFMALFGVNLIRYGMAYLDFSSKKYESASTQFEKLENFLNSPDMVIEADYKQALVVCESDPKSCIGLLENLLDKDHKGLEDSYNQWVYTYATSLFGQKNYNDALTYFTKITVYQDSKAKITESYYLGALDKYAQGSAFYTEAFSDMEKAALENYKDASEILKGWTYDQAVALAADKQYASAL